MTTPRERIVRPSSLTTYLDCPRRWAARHLTDEVTAAGYDLARAQPSSAGALVGSGVHAGNAFTLEQKRAGHEAAADDAVQAGIEGLRQRVQSEGATWDETTPSANTAEQQVARMVKTWRIHVARTVQGLIIQATNAKVQAMAWQQRIAINGGYPYSQTYAQECADWWQARLVHLLTQIIAGDEATLVAQGGKP